MADEKKAKKTKKAGESAAAVTPAEEAAPPAAAEPEPPAAAAAAPEEPSVEPPAPAPAPQPQPVESGGSAISNPTNASNDLQRLEEKAKKAEELHAAEVKVRKELEVLNAKLLAEKTALLDSLSGEKGQLQDFQERNAKMTAQKNDLENQLRVSINLLICLIYFLHSFFSHTWQKLIKCNQVDQLLGYFKKIAS